MQPRPRAETVSGAAVPRVRRGKVMSPTERVRARSRSSRRPVRPQAGVPPLRALCERAYDDAITHDRSRRMTAADVEPPRRPAATRRHGVHRFLGRLHEVLDGVGTDTAWALSPEELAQCVVEAYAAQARVAALTVGLVGQADRSGLAAHGGVGGPGGLFRGRGVV